MCCSGHSLRATHPLYLMCLGTTLSFFGVILTCLFSGPGRINNIQRVCLFLCLRVLSPWSFLVFRTFKHTHPFPSLLFPFSPLRFFIYQQPVVVKFTLNGKVARSTLGLTHSPQSPSLITALFRVGYHLNASLRNDDDDDNDDID